MSTHIKTWAPMLWALCATACTDKNDSPPGACAEGYKRAPSGCVPVTDSEPDPSEDSGQGGETPADTGTDSPPQDTASTVDTAAPVDTGDPPGPTIEIADCDIPLTGIEWSVASPIIDDSGDIAAELAAMDFSALPSAIDLSALDSYALAMVGYGLDIPVEDLGTSLDRDTTLAIGVMGQVVVGSLQTEGSFDQDFFRRGMFRYYACSRGFPMTLDGFKELYGFPTTSSVLTSEVKCIERKLGRDTTLGISYVTAADPAEFAETEIILKNNRVDGQIDFVVYGEDNRLTNRSAFPTPGGMEEVVQPTPHICIECHARNSMGPGGGFTLDPTEAPEVMDPRVYGLCP